jgi:hypothetical protein
VFVYSGAPALGNPPIFWATSAAVDPFGNVIPSTAGVASTGTFRAGNTIINSNGIFTYSGTPALDNLIYSADVAVAGSDPFGNSVLAGFTSYFGSSTKWQALNLGGIAGAVVWYQMTTADMNGAWTQIGQITPIFNAGVILNSSGQGFAFGSADAVQVNNAIQLFAQAVRPTPPSASYPVLYANPNGTLSEVHGSGFGGLPLDRCQTDVATFGPMTASLTPTAFSHQYTIPANDLAVGSEVVLEVSFHGSWPTTASNLQLWIAINGTQRAPFQLAGLSGAAVTFGGTVRFHVKCVTIGAGGTINVHGEGSVSDTTSNRSPTTGIAPTSNVIGAALNTTTATTVQIFAEWMAAGTGQTVTSDDSTLMRKGN